MDSLELPFENARSSSTTFGLTHEALRVMEEAIHKKLCVSMKTPVFFVFSSAAISPDDQNAATVLRALSNFERKGEIIPLVDFPVIRQQLFPDGGISSWPSVNLHCCALDSKSVEKIKDLIKTTLWPVWTFNFSDVEGSAVESVNGQNLQTLVSILTSREKQTTNSELSRKVRSLSEFGLFSPAPKKAVNGVQVISFDHGGGHFYRFRLPESKLQVLPPAFSSLKTFLQSLSHDCPNHFFKSPGPRMSAVDIPIQITTNHSLTHPLISFARAGLNSGRYKGAHDNVEVHCVESDPATIAVEVPVWIEPGELGVFSMLFSPQFALTGHIDLIRFNDGRIEIWDFKPGADQEKKASLQVLLYAIAIAIRSGLPLNLFRCGYFDDGVAFEFKPEDLL